MNKSSDIKLFKISDTVTFDMADNHPEWFNTPLLTYVSMKKELLGKFVMESYWGEFGTEQQIIATSTLLDYFEKTRALADQFPHLKGEIVVDNKNLFIQRSLPIPDKLYEQLLLAIVEGTEEYNSIWEQPISVTLAKMEKFLVRRRTGCLLYYQSNALAEVHSEELIQASEEDINDQRSEEMAKAGTILRKLRQTIYSKIKYSQSVQVDIRDYHSFAEDYIGKYDSTLSVAEAETLRRKVNLVRKAAKSSLSRAKARSRTSSTLHLGPYAKDSYVDKEDPKLVTVEEAEEINDIVPETIGVLENVGLDNNYDDKTVSDQYSQEDEDHLVLVLPDVPEDSDSEAVERLDIFGDNIDEKLKQRLTKLQFFSRAWTQDSSFALQANRDPFNISEAFTEDVESGKSTEIPPIVSTEEDRIQFNDWYYTKVGRPQDHQLEILDTLCQSCTSAAPTKISGYPLNTPSKDKLSMSSISSVAKDILITNSNPNIDSFEIKKQQGLLDVIHDLCYMQVYVVTMVISASIFLDRLNMVIRNIKSAPDYLLSSNHASADLATQPSREAYPPEPGHLDMDDVQGDQVVTQGLSWWNVSPWRRQGTGTPWRRQGIIVTKLY